MAQLGRTGIIFAILIELALFIYSPMMGIILLSFLMYNANLDYSQNPRHYRMVLIYILLCSLVLGLINVTKVPQNDLVWYMEHFHDSKAYGMVAYMKYGLRGYFENYWKEPVYSMLVWIINKVTFDNGAAFKCILTMINYCVMGYALVLFAKKINCSTHCLIVGVVSLCFIPYIFTMSLQLNRQFLCNSLLMLIAVRTCFYAKKDYLLMIAMVLIHSTGFFFLPLLLLPALDKHIKDAKLWYVSIVVLVVGIFFFSNLFQSSLLGKFAPTSYALSRASGTLDSEHFQMLGMSKILMAIGFAVLAVYVSYMSIHKDVPGVKRFGNIIVFLTLFILVNIQNTELAMRFCFYLFPFTPFLFLFVISIIPKSELMMPILFAFLFYFFVVYLEIGTWTYVFPEDVLFTHIYEFHEP